MAKLSHDKKEARQQIAEDLAAFLKKGGKIEVIKRGRTGYKAKRHIVFNKQQEK